MPTAPHSEAIEFCTRATLGDIGIALVAFWVVAAVRSRGWVLRPRAKEVWAFTLLGVATTTAAEWLFTEVWDR